MTVKRTQRAKPAESLEYDRFADFAKKLGRVPKREIAAERAKNGNGKKPEPA